MKKWILLALFSFLTVQATAQGEVPLSDAEVDEILFDQMVMPNEGPLPYLLADPQNPDNPFPPPHEGQEPPRNPAPGPAPAPAPPTNPTEFTMGSGSASRIGTRTFTFYAPLSMPRLYSLRLIATRGNIQVERVSVTYADTRTIYDLPQLRGDLVGSRSALLYGQLVFRIDVSVSAKFFRKPGSFVLKATATP